MLDIVPGLTFSEMQFHSQGRRKPEEFSCRTNKQNKHPRRRQEKEAGVDEKISRYFSNEKASGINPCLKLGGKAGAITDRQEQRLCDQNSSSRPPVDLPDRPFLGFGSRGPNVSSPLCYHHDLPPSDIIANMSKRMTPTSTTYYAWSQTDTAQLAEDNTPPERSAVQEQNLIRVEPSPIRRTRVSDRSTKKVTHNSVSPSYQDASECVKEPQKAGVSKPQSKSEPPQEWTDGHLSGSGSREQAVQTENVIIMESTMDNSIDVQPLRVIHDQLQEADATEMETSRIVTPDFTKRNPINSLLDMFLRLREDKVTGSVQVRQQCRQRHLNSKSLSPKDTPSKTQPQARGNTAESFHQLAPWMERKPQRSTGPTHFSSLPQESNTPATVAPFSFPQAELRYLKQQQTSTQRERQCFGFENPNMSSTQYLASSHTQVGCDNLFERQQNQGMMAWPSGNANLIGGSSFHATREPKAYDISINDIDLFDHDKEYDQIDGENQNGSELLEVQYEAEDYADHNYSSEFQLHENPWHSATHCPNSGQELEHLSEQEDCSAHRKPHEERLHMDNDSSQALPSPSTTDRSKPLEGFIGQRRLPHLSNELPPSPLSAISRPWTRESDYRIRGSSSLRDGQVSKDKSLAGFWKPNRLY